jgi:hypothetical protein
MSDRRIAILAAIAVAIAVPLITTGLVIADQYYTKWKNSR